MSNILEITKNHNAAITYKDIFTIPNSVIMHVCNIEGGFGGGFAGSLNAKSSKFKEEYRDLINTHGANLLGKASYHMHEGLNVFNLYAMPFYRKLNDSPGTVYISYEALSSSIDDALQMTEATRIVMPYHVGAGLAGGDWETILNILDSKLEFYTLCALPGVKYYNY